MRSFFHLRTRRVTVCLLIAVSLGCVSPYRAEAQFLKRLTQGISCAAGGLAGVKLGEKIAEFEAKRLNLSPEDAARHKKAFQIGVGLALCGVGAAVAGTTFSRLSKRGEERRKRELEAALEDAQPRTYADPDRPSLTGSVTVQPTITEGNKECRIVEDVLVDGAMSDQALVKYCRTAGEAWKVDIL
jgi:hypothetical protein